MAFEMYIAFVNGNNIELGLTNALVELGSTINHAEQT